MSIDLKMPALSPTMEKGTIAKWLVAVGSVVQPGDALAEIETDKATMEYEAMDYGTIIQLVLPEGSDDVPVGAVIAVLNGSTVAGDPPPNGCAPPAAEPAEELPQIKLVPHLPLETLPTVDSDGAEAGAHVDASFLVRRMAARAGLDPNSLRGTGPNGQIVKADIDRTMDWHSVASAAPSAMPPPSTFVTMTPTVPLVPHTIAKLSSMRRTIARRLSESKQQIPHIYLSVDVRLDALLRLRSELNGAIADRGVKLTVNDLAIKALAVALRLEPSCNVMFAGKELVSFQRSDISVAVSVPNGLITPVVKGADGKSLSAIATEIRELAGLARDGKLLPEAYQGGTASLSNLGMYGIRQFPAVINPPQAMILAVGAGERRSHVSGEDISVATVMSVTGSFDHRAIDGADAARFMQAFRHLIENPLELVA